MFARLKDWRRIVTEELVELYRQALPQEQALWREIITGREMPDEQRNAALTAVQAFNRAAGVMPWEHSPLSPRANGPGSLQSALLAKVNGVEAEAFRRYARKWQKRHDEDMALWAGQRITPSRAKAALTAARRKPKLDPVS